VSSLAEREAPTPDELAEQVRLLDVGTFLLSFSATLTSLAYAKLEAERLDDMRLAVDALRALVPLLEGNVEAGAVRDLSRALANLQLAYANAVAGASQPGE
jgi:hypothetical protein